MIAFLESRSGRAFQWVVGSTLLVVLALAIGRVVPTRPGLGIAAALLVLALGLASAEPAAIPLMAMPLMLWGGRIGAGGIDLTVSDAVLFGATAAALVFTTRPFSPQLRTILWLSGAYQFATLFTVVGNPFLANAVEWVHAWMLIAGALIVGWTVGRRGYGRLGLSLFLAAALLLAAITIVQGALKFAQGDFSAVFVTWPFPMHKNFVGTLLGFAAVTAYSRPAWVGWHRRWALSAFWVLIAALLFTQSRQAIIGVAVALIFVALRGDEHRRRSKLIVFFAVPLLVLVGSLVKDQVDSGNQFNSVFQRLNWFEETIEYWSHSPWIGHGLRFWRVAGEMPYQPPNAELEVLASGGVLGLVAFLVMMGGILVVLWRLDTAYGTLATAVVLARFVQGQFDLFWTSAQASVPFVIVGVCLGAEALSRDSLTVQALTSEQSIKVGL